MKKLIFVLLCSLIGVGASMASEPDYVISDGKVYFVESLSVRPWNVITGKSEGERLRFKASEVEGYRKDGEVFRMLPVVENNQMTNKTAFMKAIAYRGGYTVYQYSPVVSNYKNETHYFVFRGEEYFLTIDYTISKSLSMYFSYAQ
jgi:hypothetical protein